MYFHKASDTPSWDLWWHLSFTELPRIGRRVSYILRFIFDATSADLLDPTYYYHRSQAGGLRISVTHNILYYTSNVCFQHQWYQCLNIFYHTCSITLFPSVFCGTTLIQHLTNTYLCTVIFQDHESPADCPPNWTDIDEILISSRRLNRNHGKSTMALGNSFTVHYDVSP